MLLLLSSLLLVGVRVEGAGQPNSQAVNMYKHHFNGDATYYGGSGGGGTCGYGLPNPPVASRVDMTIALNRPHFMGAVMCGSCWRVTGSGHGLGNSPVTGTRDVFVDDLCPECHEGSVDLGVSGDGRWDVSIQAIPCPVGSDKIDFKFEGSNPWYIKLQARNFRYPVHKMEIEHNGWHQMTHTSDGYFTFNHGPVNGGFRVRLTAINGQQVIENISGIREWTPGAGIMEADDRQVTTVPPPFHHRHSTNPVS